MKVVLLKDHAKTGKKGEIVEVKPGFARNFLIPKDIAKAATPEAIKRAKAKAKKKEEKREEATNTVESLANKINMKSVRVPIETSSGGRAFASVGKDEIMKLVNKEWEISGKDVSIELDLAQPVKEVGKYPVDAVISGGGKEKKVTVILEVVGKE